MKCFEIDSKSRLKNEYIEISFAEYCHDEPIHTHKFIEFVYIVEGTGIHKVDNNVIKVKHGTLLVMNNTCCHEFENIDSMKYYNLKLSPYFLSEELKKEDSMDSLFKFFGFDIDENYIHMELSEKEIGKKIENSFFDIMYESIEKETGYIDVVNAKTKELIVTIGRAYKSQIKKVEKENNVLEECLLYITNHCCEHITLKEVADKFGYEQSYFSRMLKKYLGYSFKQLLIKKRLSKALDVLWTSDKNIDEIISDCGFTRKSFFYTAFREQYGVNPKFLRDYKKNYDDHVVISMKIQKKSEKDTF